MRFGIVLSVLCSCAIGLSSCTQTKYVIKAGIGQMALWMQARPVDEVIRDPATDARTRVLLEESVSIRRFANRTGLRTKGSYKKFVQLDRGSVVWFFAASKPLAFEPKRWSFPIVGSFPYLGWFNIADARDIARDMKADGWDVMIRRVRAFSTGGWFNDPVVSTMFSHEDDAFRYLANVMLHELTHANVFVNNQTTFNESVASFVGDTMAEEYLAARFGADSEQVTLFREEQAESLERGKAMAQAYSQLEALYQSGKSDADKRDQKQRILTSLDRQLDLGYEPNNATLSGFKTYNAGMDEFGKLYDAAGRDWDRFLAAVKGLKESDFPEQQMDAIGPVILTLAGKVSRGAPLPERQARAPVQPSELSRRCAHRRSALSM